MKYGRLRTDESSHNYLVPEDEVKLFDELTAQIYNENEYGDIWYEKIEEFNERFSGYRIDGTGDLRVLIEEK